MKLQKFVKLQKIKFNIMRYLLVKTENMPILALALGSLDYKAGNSPIFPIAFGEFSILIDKEDKTFFYVKGRKEIDKFVEDHAKIYTTNDLSHALEFLKEDEDEETDKSEEDKEEIDLKTIFEHPLMQIFSRHIPKDILTKCIMEAKEEREEEETAEKNSESTRNEESSFYKELVPGRIVQFENAGMIRYGIVLSNGTVMHFSGSNLAASGYINNITEDRPYRVVRILKPTSQYYNLKDVNNMEVAWERKVRKPKVTKTITEIEKELGLAPGSLVIE